MPELRWALLVLGVLFLAGLAAWELRRTRRAHAPRPDAQSIAPSDSAVGHVDGEPSIGRLGLDARRDQGHAEFNPAAPSRTEPRIDLDSLDVAAAADSERPAVERRQSGGPLPVVEIVDPSVAGEIDVAGAQASASNAGAYLAAREEQAAEADLRARTDAAARAEAWLAEQEAAVEPRALRLEWPPEEQRQIVALRLMAREGESFTGAALRQGLIGEGFVHGEFDIFHKPLGDGRVVVSAASLTRPGTFDLQTIDTQIFQGLNLFCVLPGPLPHRESLERLLQSGRVLAQRLRGTLGDARGRPLSDARLAELRREVAAMAQSAGAAAAAERPAVSSG